MKTKILDALKAKFEGVSDAILGRIADKLAKTTKTEEDVKPAVDGVTLQQVLESYGDSRATEAQKTAIKNYETQHGLKDGVKVEPAKTDPTPNKAEPNIDMPEWAKEFVETNRKLKEELEALKGEKTANTRKSALDNIIKSLPDEFRTRYERDFARLSFKDEDDFNAWLDDTKKDVEGIEMKLSAYSSPLGGSQFGAKDESGVSKLVKEKFAEQKAQAEKQPSAVGGL